MRSGAEVSGPHGRAARSRQVRLTGGARYARDAGRPCWFTALPQKPTTASGIAPGLLLAGFRSECLGLRHACTILPVLASARFQQHAG